MARRPRDVVRRAPLSHRGRFTERMTAGLFYRAHNMVSVDKIAGNAGGFQLMDRKDPHVIRAMRERNRVMKDLFAWANLRQASFEPDRAERETGTTK